MTEHGRPARETRVPLAPDPERQLVLAAKEQGGAKRDELIAAFMPLIGSVARIYWRSAGVERRELLQEGVVGLLRALERYDPSLGTPFWAYASWWVRQAMQQLVCELTRPVVLSDRALRQLARVKRAQRAYVDGHGREPTTSELARAAELPPDQVRSLIAAERRPRPLEEPVGGDHDVADAFVERLADPRAEDAFERVPRRIAMEGLASMLDQLSDRERLIVRGHFGLDGPERTLREIADGLGVSAERVRQIEHAALEKLREAAGPARAPRCAW